MTRTAWAPFGAVGLLVAAAYLALPTPVQEVLYPAVSLACAVAVVAGLRLHRPARPAPWVLLASGLLLWTLGDVAYSVYDVVLGEPPFPSWADALYLAGYPTMVAAVVVVVRRTGVRDAVAWQDAGIWGIAATLLCWPWLLEPTFLAEGGTALATSVAVAFPLLDLLLLLFLLRLVSGRRRAAVPGLLAAALTCYLVSDVLYGLQALAGTYASGGPVDLGWVASYVAIGTLALHPRMVELAEPGTGGGVPGRMRWAGLGAAALLAPGMLVAQDLWSDHVDVVVVAGAAAVMFLLTTLRGAGLVRELRATTDELRSRERELHRRATTDVLTGLANRSVLQERLGGAEGSGEALSVALLDLDDFKHVNDSRGHEAGDQLLLAVSARLVAALPPADLVARLGGDEFAVVSSAAPSTLAARLLECLPSTVLLGGTEVRVAASIGVAGNDGARRSSSELLRHADLAMYAAKAAGGGRSAVYRPEMSAELMLRLESRHLLAEGVERGEFVAHLQPVVDLATHRLLGFEALARWARPGAPALGPAGWLACAEETGLVVEVDVQVLRAAARQLVRWSDEVAGAASLDLAVNASGRSLLERDVADRLLTVLREEGLSPERVVLEVTEGVLIDETVGSRLQQLRDAGVRIALDDFGTGWSSLTYLRRFPVDMLKIDRSFVAGIADGEGAEAVPAAVLQLASALGLDVVAEGVETPEQAAVLRRLGCRTAQGYLLGRPAAPEDLERTVRHGRVEGGPAVTALPLQRRG